MDRDALDLLRLLAPHNKAYGIFLSELVRAKVVRREERRKIAQELIEKSAVVLAG
jgi:hypothetical protein